MAIRPTTEASSQTRLARELAEVDAHADGEEEHAEQQALERLDGRLDGLAEFGLGQQQAGDEGAERHRQAGQRRRRRRCRRSRTGSPRRTARWRPVAATSRNSGRSSSRPTMTISADGQRRLRQRQHDAGRAIEPPVAAPRMRDEQQHRHDGQVLRQQHGEAGAAGRRSSGGAGWTAPR